MSLLALASVATAKPLTFAEKVVAIEAAESTELARLEEAIAAASSQADVVALQRCASYVKLASRLAFYQAQIPRAVADQATADALAAQIAELQARVDAQAAALPDDYRFTPLPAIAQEVPACDE
jgi:hypothetical protein